MNKIINLINCLGECDTSQRPKKKKVILKSFLERYSYTLMIISLVICPLMLILALIYKFAYSSDILKLIVLLLEIIVLISFILGLLFQIIPAILHIINFKKESQILLIDRIKHSEEVVNILSKYEQCTLEDSKEHLQIKINCNTSKTYLVIGQNVTVIFLLGLFYSCNENVLDIVTIFSNIWQQQYSLWTFLKWILFCLILGFYLGAFGLSLENRRLSYYIDLINMTLKRKQREI